MAKLKGLLELMDEALNMDAAYEGVKRLGLKKGNTAADRAKALGFDTKTYHGTDKNFNQFDLSKSGSTSNMDGNLGIFTSNNPAVADSFAKFASYDNPINYPLLVRHKKSFVPNEYEDITRLVDKHITSDYKPHILPDKFGGTRVRMMGDIVNQKNLQKSLTDKGYDSVNVKNTTMDSPDGKTLIDQYVTLNPANIRSIFAKFNPKKAGIGAGSIMSADLLAAPSGQPEFRETPMGFLDKAKKYAADSYEYAANEGGLLGNILYGGGARALRNLERGTTPMVKTGRLPAVPTGDALLDLMSLLQI
tara:strand:+ start:4226 stop:5140 length:915 start_codon:yes stop_codon:yes gene_type:complete